MGRFVDNNDGTVFDSQKDLVWEKLGSKVKLDWSIAVRRSKELYLAKYSDWRLPTIEELCSIVDYTRIAPAIDPIFDCKPTWYWSGSSYAGSAGFAWDVGFGYGAVGHSHKSGDYYVRCVRDLRASEFKWLQKLKAGDTVVRLFRRSGE